MELEPLESRLQDDINHIILSSKRLVTQAARIELDAKSLEDCADVEAIRNIHRKLTVGEMESPVSDLLGIFSRTSEDVDAALNQESAYNQRLALKAVAELLDAQLQELTRNSNKYVSRFYPITKSWYQIIANEVETLIVLTELSQEIDSPYVIEIPLHEKQEIFVQPATQPATQAARIELDAKSLQDCDDVEAIRNIHRKLTVGELESPVSALLGIFSRTSEDVDAALNQESVYNQRLALKAVAERLDAQLQELTRSSNKYVSRFYPITEKWYQIIANEVETLIVFTELFQQIDIPYVIGIPLHEKQEIFVQPADISGTYINAHIEQLLLDRRRPPLLLYGQRRMGKTSLLHNLGRLLPNTIIPMFVDLQGPVSSASNHAGFLYNIAKSMINSAKKQGFTVLPLTHEALEDDPFTTFDEWLDEVERTLKQNTALLMLDEFEALDSAIAKGRFDEQDVLGMLRNIIQHRSQFKLLIAGSHTIEEYQRWASYLINVQVVHISYLKEDEARLLIEHPVKDFTLRYEPDAVERVLQLTRCHAFLVQLLCAEIVVLKNEQEENSMRRLATLADVEAAIPQALRSGSFFFADIQNNQVNATEVAILYLLAAQGEKAKTNRQIISQQFPDECDRSLNLLLQRELIEEVDNGYRFQVELIRRWFT